MTSIKKVPKSLD